MASDEKITIDVTKFCEDVNRCMAWMKMGVLIAQVSAGAAIIISIVGVVMK